MLIIQVFYVLRVGGLYVNVFDFVCLTCASKNQTLFQAWIEMRLICIWTTWVLGGTR